MGLWMLLCRGHRIARGECGVFGRAIRIDQHALRVLLAHSADMVRRQYIPAGDELAHRIQTFTMGIDHLVKKSGCQPERTNPVVLDHVRKLFERWRGRRHDYQPRAVKQAAPNFEG